MTYESRSLETHRDLKENFIKSKEIFKFPDEKNKQTRMPDLPNLIYKLIMITVGFLHYENG